MEASFLAGGFFGDCRVGHWTSLATCRRSAGERPQRDADSKRSDAVFLNMERLGRF